MINLCEEDYKLMYEGMIRNIIIGRKLGKKEEVEEWRQKIDKISDKIDRVFVGVF